MPKKTIQDLFDEFGDKIKDPEYLPKTPVETLMARMTAVSYLCADDKILAGHAANFISRTSTTPVADVNRLTALAASVQAWLGLEVLSIYTNPNGIPCVEYKLRFATAKAVQEVHLHASYKMMPDGQCIYVSQHAPFVRIIGDPILHRPGLPFPVNPPPSAEQLAELRRQIAIAKDILVQTSGGGIAANQCATIESPYQFAIVGVFKENPAHVQGVARRYPGANFPAAMIMVNPKIISRSERVQNFKHACLSVPSPNRCEVQSPEEITVEYLDPTKNMARVRVSLKGMDAVVLWHEMNHIIDGKTYIDTALASLTPADLSKFATLVADELSRRRIEPVVPELTVPPFYFTITINEQGKAHLDEVKLTDVLPKLTTETLNGFLSQCYALKEEAQGIAEKKSFEASIKMGTFSQKPSLGAAEELVPTLLSRL